MSISDALSTLPPEVRAVIEAQLKRTATAKQFEHVAYSQYYDESTVEGQTRRTPSGLSNTNVLKISHDKKAFGKRSVAVSIGRNRDNTLTITNAAFFPVSAVALSKDGHMTVTLNDTFNAQEAAFIATWAKSKYAERPAQAATAAVTTVETPQTAAVSTAPATSAGVTPQQVKVALIKAKIKPDETNVSLVNDLMTQGGQTLAEAVASLAA